MSLLSKAWIGVKYEFKAIGHSPRYLFFYYAFPLFVILLFGFNYKIQWSAMFLKENPVSDSAFLLTIKVSAFFFFFISTFQIVVILTKTTNYIDTNFHQFLEVFLVYFKYRCPNVIDSSDE